MAQWYREDYSRALARNQIIFYRAPVAKKERRKILRLYIFDASNEVAAGAASSIVGNLLELGQEGMTAAHEQGDGTGHDVAEFGCGVGQDFKGHPH